MDRKTVARLRRNAERCKQEQTEIADALKLKNAVRTSEAAGCLAAWVSRTIADNERRGLSLGC